MHATVLLDKVRAQSLAHVPHVILVDAHSSRTAAQAAGVEGFAAYLTKPLRCVRLLRCLNSLTGENPTRAEAQATLAPDAAKPRAQASSPSGVRRQAPVAQDTEGSGAELHHSGRILVAEDNQVNQLIICAQLKKLGHRVTTVINGQEAIDALEHASFDLVFMDCQMPVLDGYQATRQIRKMQDGALGHLPIIALTANAMREDKERCLAAGMDDYVSKPFTPKILSEVVRAWMQPKA